MSSDIIDSHLTNIIKSDISQKHYSENAKTATVRPIFKKNDRTKVKNCKPVSLLNIFSKIYEMFIHGNLKNYIDSFLSRFMSAYRKSYSSNHVVLILIENGEKVTRSKQICRCNPYGLVQGI